MFGKKKRRISKRLAAISHIAENELGISIEGFGKLIDNIYELAYDIGGIKMMNTTYKYLLELRKLKSGVTDTNVGSKKERGAE